MAEYKDPILKEIADKFDTMPPQQQHMFRTLVIQESADRGLIEGPSVLDKASYGFDDVASNFTAMGQIAKQMTAVHGIRSKVWQEATEEYNKELDHLRAQGLLTGETLARAEQRRQEAVQERDKEAQLRLTAMREKAQRDKDDRMRKEYQYIWGTDYESDFATNAGRFGKYLLDPSTLLPLGHTAKAASMIGAGIGAWDTMVRELAESGEIDPVESGIAMGAGAILGPLFAVLGPKVFKFLGDKQSEGSKVTAQELKDQMHTAHVDQANYQRLANKINELIDNPAFDSKMSYTAIRNKFGTSYAAAWREWRQQLQREVDIDIQTYDSLIQAMKNPLLSDSDRHIMAENAVSIKREQMENMWKSRAKVDDVTDDMWDNNIFKRTDIPVSSPHRGTIFTYKLDENDSIEKLTSNAAAKIKKEVEEIANEKVKSSTMQSAMRSALDGAMEKATASKDAQRSAEIAQLRNQAGAVSHNLLMHMGGASAGTAAGYALGGEEGAAMGFLVGAGLPFFKANPYKTLGKWTDSLSGVNRDIKRSTLGEYLSRPSERLKTFGNAGRWAERALDLAEMKTKAIANRYLYGIGRRLQNLTPENQKALISHLQGVKKAEDKDVVELAKDIRERLNEVVHEARRRDIIGHQKAQNLLQSNYWPRLYNDEYLSTAEGKEAWVKLLSERGFDSREKIENIIRHVTAGDDQVAKKFIASINKKGERYFLSAGQADRLRIRRGVITDKTRSRHLENRRTLLLDDADLQPFMHHDPRVILGEYFNDVGKRFAYAEMFGKSDEIAHSMYKAIKSETGEDEPADFFLQVFYQSVGDSKSDVVRRNALIGENQKRALGALTAFETLKLSLAPMLNAMQATVNGLTMASKYGARHALKTYLQGIRGLFTKGEEGMFLPKGVGNMPWNTIEGEFNREASSRSAAAFETTILQVLGEGQQHSTIWGARRSEDMNLLARGFDVFNNPSKFLRAIGFVGVEKIQRHLAANMGKAHFEELMSAKARLEAGAFDKSPKSKAKFERFVKEGLEELRLDPDKRVSEYTVDDAFQAMHKFSNIVNFTNDVSKLPMFAKRPYARLVIKFKSFAFNQGAFIVDNVMAPARRFMKTGGKEGSVLPLMTYLGVGTHAGMTAHQLRRWVAGDDDDLTMTERYLKGIMYVGGLGIMLDGIVGFTDNFAGKSVGTIAGPVAGDVWTLYNGMARSVAKGWEGSLTDMGTYAPTVRAAGKITGGGFGIPFTDINKRTLMEELSLIAKERKATESARSMSRTSHRDVTR